MGHHYTPQRLLRNFEDPLRRGYIWQHDKRREGSIQAAISKVAQERDFYDPDTEELLNRAIEIPGGDAIDKILARQPLTPEDQVHLTIHIGTMLQRTPFHRQWAREISKDIVPKAMEIVREHGRNYIHLLAQTNRLSEERVNTWLAEMEKSIEKLDGKSPREAVERLNNPFPSQTIVGALIDMTWRIVESTGPQLFITSDNPAVYFRAEGYGLGGKETEVVLAISTTVALHGSRNRSHPNFTRMKVTPKTVPRVQQASGT